MYTYMFGNMVFIFCSCHIERGEGEPGDYAIPPLNPSSATEYHCTRISQPSVHCNSSSSLYLQAFEYYLPSTKKNFALVLYSVQYDFQLSRCMYVLQGVLVSWVFAILIFLCLYSQPVKKKPAEDASEATPTDTPPAEKPKSAPPKKKPAAAVAMATSGGGGAKGKGKGKKGGGGVMFEPPDQPEPNIAVSLW